MCNTVRGAQDVYGTITVIGVGGIGMMISCGYGFVVR